MSDPNTQHHECPYCTRPIPMSDHIPHSTPSLPHEQPEVEPRKEDACPPPR